MIAPEQNLANGYGYSLEIGTGLRPGYIPEFELDVDEVMEEAIENDGRCLVEGLPGTGKSHLIHEIGAAARETYDVATLTFHAHINGGSTKGVENGLRVLDQFVTLYGHDGLLIVDNADYYGFSGNTTKRRISLAEKHLKVAGFIKEIIDDVNGPAVVGTSHDQEWRDNHWRYPERKGDADTVTAEAQTLLNAFPVKYDFTGELLPDTAFRLLTKQFDHSTAMSIINGLHANSCLTHRFVSNLDPSSLSERGIIGEIRRITVETRRLIGSLSVRNANST